ncbi:hypothetical protein AB0K00_34415 [Dactylosporangium sp. NPDC049525]|uniref:hypothetical protein n=1 Tax=Dactylosporangium sp. NPDC049525 TaxID=3154730 RepID=UPI003425BC4B
MRRFLTAALLVAIVGTSGACASTDDTASTGASAGTASAASSKAPSVDVAANTKDICTRSEALIKEDEVREVGRQVGLIIAARQQKNADAEAKAKTAIRAKTDSWAKDLGVMQQEAADPALKAALGTLITALTTLGKDDYLAGFKSTADAAKLEATLTTATDAMSKVCG